MLYQKLGRPALGKTIKLVGQNAAEEIVQDVFTKLWQKGMIFPNIKSAFAWVYKCCTNGAIDYLRNNNNGQISLSEIDVQASGSTNLEEQITARQVWLRLIQTLSEDEAELFIYRHLEGLSQDETAEVMQISRRTVNRLQDKLDQNLDKIRRRQSVG